MDIKTVLSPDLGSLEWENNAHLFEWNGELLLGRGEPVATHPVDALPEPGLDDFGYQKYRRDSAPLPDRENKPDKTVPEISLKEMRRRIFSQSREDEKIPSGFARPTEASAFQLRQNLRAFESTINNPLLGEWDLEFFDELLSIANEIHDAPYLDGVLWAANELSQSAMGMNLISAELVQMLGMAGTAQTLAQHFPHHKTPSELFAICTRFREQDLARVQNAITAKLQRISAQSQRWMDKARLQINNADGSPNLTLTLANAATGLVGIKALHQVAIAHYSFGRGAAELVESVSNSVSSASF